MVRETDPVSRKRSLRPTTPCMTTPPRSKEGDSDTMGESVEASRKEKPISSEQRLINLLFTLDMAASPLSTERILGDTDLGYGAATRTASKDGSAPSKAYASDDRKFRRDRKQLEQQGIWIVPVCEDGSPVNEASAWMLDRKSTFAERDLISRDDLEVLVGAIDEYLEMLASPLAQVRKTASALLASADPALPSAGGGAGAAHDAANGIWAGFALKKKLLIEYAGGSEPMAHRTISVYGIFSHTGHSYCVALDESLQKIRTFRIDRITVLGALKESYEVPAGFNVRDYLFFPFDFAPSDKVDATFDLPSYLERGEIDALTHDRGEVSRAADGSWTWTVPVRDIDAAAALALEHARDGMRPRAPQDLVDRWHEMIGKAVEAHER